MRLDVSSGWTFQANRFFFFHNFILTISNDIFTSYIIYFDKYWLLNVVNDNILIDEERFTAFITKSGTNGKR